MAGKKKIKNKEGKSEIELQKNGRRITSTMNTKGIFPGEFMFVILPPLTESKAVL